MTAADVLPPPASARPVFFATAVPLVFLYAATVAPTVTGEDSGELIAAAHTLGVAHPPGYPLWILLTKGLQLLFSGVSVAHASNLASALTTAAACGLLAVLALRLRVGSVIATATGLLAGLSHEIWNHATIAEVYPLALLLFVAAVLLLLRWRERPTLRRWFALSLVLGLGVSHHPLLLLFGPAFFGAALIAAPRRVLEPRALLVGAAGLLVPFLAYAQVYVAAGSDPVMSWGAEPTLRAMFGHWNREIYGSGPAKTPFTFEKAFAQAAAFCRFHVENLTLPGAALAFLGLGVLVRRGGFAGRLVFALYLSGAPLLVLLLRSDLEREDLFASRVFLMPADLLLAAGIGAVLRVVVDRAPVPLRPRLAAASLLLPVAFGAAGFSSHDRSNYRWSEDYGRAILDGCPQGALLFPGGDTSTFPLIYLQYVENVRPDVLVLDRSGTVERDEALALLPAEARPAAARASREDLLGILARKSGRPVVSLRPERGSDDLASEAAGMGFVFLAAGDAKGRAEAATRQRAFVDALALRNETAPTVSDATSDLIRSHLAQVRAADAFARGRPAEARRFADEAVRVAQGIKETLNNVGSLLADHGETEAALETLKAALAIRADYALARRNLVVVLRGLGRAAEATRVAAAGLRLDPTDVVLFREGVAAASAADDGAALKRFCALRIAAAPFDPEPHRRLGDWAKDRAASPLAAKAHYEAALRLDPGDDAVRQSLADLGGEGDPTLPPVPDGAAPPFAAADLAAAALRRGPLERSFPTSPKLRRDADQSRGFMPGSEQLAHLRAQLAGVGWTDPSAGLPRTGTHGEDR